MSINCNVSVLDMSMSKVSITEVFVFHLQQVSSTNQKLAPTLEASHTPPLGVTCTPPLEATRTPERMLASIANSRFSNMTSSNRLGSIKNGLKADEVTPFKVKLMR